MEKVGGGHCGRGTSYLRGLCLAWPKEGRGCEWVLGAWCLLAHRCLVPARHLFIVLSQGPHWVLGGSLGPALPQLCPLLL